jgi:hypothetical protein
MNRSDKMNLNELLAQNLISGARKNNISEDEIKSRLITFMRHFISEEETTPLADYTIQELAEGMGGVLVYLMNNTPHFFPADIVAKFIDSEIKFDEEINNLFQNKG